QPSGPKLIFGALPDRQPEGRNRPFAVLSHRDGGRPLRAKKRSLPNGPLGGAGESVNGGARRWSGAQCDPHHSEKPPGGVKCQRSSSGATPIYRTILARTKF